MNDTFATSVLVRGVRELENLTFVTLRLYGIGEDFEEDPVSTNADIISQIS